MLNKNFNAKYKENALYNNKEMFAIVNSLFNVHKFGGEEKRSEYLLEPVQLLEINSDVRILFKQNYNINITRAFVGQRLLQNGSIYHSIQYVRKKNTNNFTCLFNDGNDNYGQILTFFYVDKCTYALVKTYETKRIDWPFYNSQLCELILRTGILDKFFKAIDKDKQRSLRLIKCDQLRSKCLELELEGEVFLTTIAYEFEHD
jgi:hypothetical protein